MTRPCSTAATMVAKLSSVKTMSAASLESSVLVTPIATPMSALFKAGGIVHPVAGRCDDVPVFLQGLDYSELVLRRDTRVDGHLLDTTFQLLAREAGEIPSCQDAPVFGDAELSCDVPGGQGMVTRDHDRVDTRSLAGTNVVPGLGRGR